MNQETELRISELNQQGRTLFSCDKYDAAIEKYRQALELDQMHLPTYFNLCEAYIMADRYDEAKKALRRVLMIDKNNGEAHFHLGNIALLEEDYEEGRLQYAKAINAGLDSPQIYINLASVAEDNDDWEQAAAYYTKAIARDRTCYTAKIRRIQIYMAMNRRAAALDAVDDLIDTNPEIFEGHHFKFLILAEEDRLDEAEKVLDKAQYLFPDDQGFVLDRVKLLELRKRYSEAMELLKTVRMDVVPEGAICLETARLYLAMDRRDEAKAILEGYQGETVAELERLLMVVYVDEKNGAGVVKCAEKILALDEYDSNYFSALYFKAYGLKLSGSAEAEAAYQEAQKMLRQACSINSGMLDLYIYRAICYRELKDYDKANEMLDYVLAVKENVAEVYYIRSLIYKDLHDERAAAELERAKALDPQIANLIGE